MCNARYADGLAALSSAARTLEQASSAYTFCVRATAVYECPSYAADGTLRRTRKRSVSHGTAFAYRQPGPGETLLLTNEHVAEWPAVTSAERRVDGVPPGCKKVSDSLRIVDNEKDAYERDDVTLARVVSDPQLDVSVLRAKSTLPVVPWKVGQSAALRERNAVMVRGFPLGVLKAENVGKVISAYDHDDENEWDHDDFVVDALLSPGNSGSPVFAVSCATGEPELVGIYHARFTNGSALNVVVGIDQVRDLMTTLKRSPRPQSQEGGVSLDATRRAELVERARATPLEPFFGFGQNPAAVWARDDGSLLFEIFDRDFPLAPTPVAVLEDLPPAEGGGFGALGRVWFGNRRGLKSWTSASLDAEAQALLTKTLDALRRDALASLAYREAAREDDGSRERFDQIRKLERGLRKTAAARGDLVQSAVELGDAKGPDPGEAALNLAEVVASSPLATLHPGAPVAAAPAAPPLNPVSLPPGATGGSVARSPDAGEAPLGAPPPSATP
jgi:serine protease Do